MAVWTQTDLYLTSRVFAVVEFEIFSNQDTAYHHKETQLQLGYEIVQQQHDFRMQAATKLVGPQDFLNPQGPQGLGFRPSPADFPSPDAKQGCKCLALAWVWN